jgi:hypothetical protein
MPSSATNPDATIPSLDQLVEEISRIDVMVDQQRALNDHTESKLFSGSCEGEKRKSAVLSIALRDELIDEMLTRRSLLIRLLAG